MMQTDKAPEARKGSSLPVLSRSRSGAANVCVHTPNTELCCEPGGGSREKVAAPSQACAIGPGAATTAPAACISGKKEQEQSICVPLPPHLCAHALQGTQPPQTQAEGQADKLHQNNSITSKQPEILYPPG